MTSSVTVRFSWTLMHAADATRHRVMHCESMSKYQASRLIH